MLWPLIRTFIASERPHSEKISSFIGSSVMIRKVKLHYLGQELNPGTYFTKHLKIKILVRSMQFVWNF